MRSTSRVTPPVVRATSALNLLMVSRPSSAPADVDEHVEPDQGDADRLLELAAQQIGELAVGAHEQAHEGQPLVVDLRQEVARPLVELGLRLIVVFALRGELRRAHIAPSTHP